MFVRLKVPIWMYCKWNTSLTKYFVVGWLTCVTSAFDSAVFLCSGCLQPVEAAGWWRCLPCSGPPGCTLHWPERERSWGTQVGGINNTVWRAGSILKVVISYSICPPLTLIFLALHPPQSRPGSHLRHCLQSIPVGSREITGPACLLMP